MFWSDICFKCLARVYIKYGNLYIFFLNHPVSIQVEKTQHKSHQSDSSIFYP